MLRISNVIRELVRQYGMSPKDISSGMCHQFAVAVVREMGGERSNLRYIAVDDASPSYDVPWHAFIWYNGKYYDAEHPSGLDDWRNFSCFRGYERELPRKVVTVGLSEAKKRGYVGV